MARTQMRLGRVRGIPVYVDASWVIMALLLTWSLARNTFPSSFPNWPLVTTWITAVATSALFFLSVLAHEVAHSLVAQASGMPVHEITLFIFGGVSRIDDEPQRPRTEFLVAFAGPLSSLVLGALLSFASGVLRGAAEPLVAVASLLSQINLSLGLFNLVPGFPLDGGRVLRAALWAWRKDFTWATRSAARVGSLVAMFLILGGIMLTFTGNAANGLWLSFIGVFLDNAARASYSQLTLRNLLSGHTVSEVMTEGCMLVPPQLTLDVFVEQYLMTEARRCYPVGSRDQVVGLVTIHQIRAVPRSAWRDTHIGDVMTPLAELKIVRPDTPLWDVLRDMTSEGVNQLPVLLDGRLVGMISRDHLISFLHSRSALVG